MENVSIDHLLDPQRKGYLLPGNPLSGKQFQEAVRLKLKNYKGGSFALAEPTRDPLSTKVLRAEAPAELRDALTQAEARYHEAEAVRKQSRATFEAAMAERARFSQDIAGSLSLTDAGSQRLRSLTVKLEAAEPDYRAAQDCETVARIERLHAAQALDRWCRDEALRRTQAAEQAAQAAKQQKPAPLSERLAKLGKKIAGK